MNLPSISLTELLLLINTAWMAFLSIGGWIVSRGKANSEQIDALRTGHGKRLDNHAERLTRLEAQHGNIPTREDVGKLALEIKQLEGSLKSVSSELKGIENISKIFKRQMDVMDDFLRAQK